jgi:hypothetical protein
MFQRSKNRWLHTIDAVRVLLTVSAGLKLTV